VPRIIAACLLFLATPALADVTARYSGMQPDSGMVVRIADNGDTFIGHGANSSYLTTGGVTYIILSDGRGAFTVRRDTFMAVLRELTLGREPPPGPGRGAAVEETGAESVAGFAGRVFRVGPRNIPSDRLEVVVSGAPELARVGRAVAAHIVPWFETVGRTAPELRTAIGDVLARGAVIRLGPLFRLEAVDSAPIPATQFALPSPPLDRAELIRRLDLSMPR
jgi:hypothetical protein